MCKSEVRGPSSRALPSQRGLTRALGNTAATSRLHPFSRRVLDPGEPGGTGSTVQTAWLQEATSEGQDSTLPEAGEIGERGGSVVRLVMAAQYGLRWHESGRWPEFRELFSKRVTAPQRACGG